VVRGAGDWLFIRDELQPTCRWTGAQQGAALGRAASAFAQRGIDFRFIVAPDKHTIYPDKLPSRTPFPPSCADANRPGLDAAIAGLGGIAIDATSALQAARTGSGTTAVYYAEDTHWTPVGAAAAVGELARSLGPGVWAADDAQVRDTKRRVLDTPELLGLRRVVRTPKVVIRPSIQQHRVEVPVPAELKNARTVFRITCTGGAVLPGRTLVVYDSFFGIDSGLVAPYFAETTWVQVNDLLDHPDLGPLLAPFDRIIVERVARELYATDLDALVATLSAPSA
jgi:alginate O-acetyltransferase complex protein AlgJ